MSEGRECKGKARVTCSRVIVCLVGAIILGAILWCVARLVRPADAHLRFLDATAVDFGVIDEDQTVRRSFRCINDGGRTLSIIKVAKSCSCTDVQVDKMHLRPGEEAAVNVTYKGRPVEGVEELGVFLQVDAPKQPIMAIRLRGIVRPRVYWHPKTVTLYGPRGSVMSQSISFASGITDNVRIASIAPSSDRIRVNCSNEMPPKCTVTVNPTGDTGNWTEYVHVEVEINDRKSQVEIPVYRIEQNDSAKGGD